MLSSPLNFELLILWTLVRKCICSHYLNSCVNKWTLRMVLYATSQGLKACSHVWICSHTGQCDQSLKTLNVKGLFYYKMKWNSEFFRKWVNNLEGRFMECKIKWKNIQYRKDKYGKLRLRKVCKDFSFSKDYQT